MVDIKEGRRLNVVEMKDTTNQGTIGTNHDIVSIQDLGGFQSKSIDPVAASVRIKEVL
jgi:hypothetical protein